MHERANESRPSKRKFGLMKAYLDKKIDVEAWAESPMYALTCAGRNTERPGSNGLHASVFCAA